MSASERVPAASSGYCGCYASQSLESALHKYVVKYGTKDGSPELDLCEFEYRKVAAAKHSLVSAFDAEQKYDCLLSNYIEFEKDATSLMIDGIVKRPAGYRGAYELRRRMNIRMLNFLSSARMYVDHIKHDAKECMNGCDKTKDEVSRFFSVQFDSNKYYRFMEGLRNHTQHFGLPVHWTLDGSQWSMSEGRKSLRESTFEFFADVEQLAEAKIVKSRILAEFSDKIDLKLAARSYIESLSHANERIREHLDPRINDAREQIECVVQRYGELGDQRKTALFAYELVDGKIVGQVSLNSEWEKVRVAMRKENPELLSFARRYVSTLSDAYSRSLRGAGLE